MSKPPAYQWYPSDFRSDENVMLMNFEQQGVYRFLLDHQWLHGSIPNNPSLLSGLTQINPEYFLANIWDKIAPCFIEKDGRLYNKRMEIERQKRVDFLEKQRENGALGGRPQQVHSEPSDQSVGKPKPKPKKTQAFQNAKPKKTSSSSSSIDSNSSHILPNRQSITSKQCERVGAKTAFSPPSLDLVLEYAKEINLPRQEAEKFMAYYESNGWRRGRNKLVCWKAALRGWKLAAKQYEPSTNGKHSTGTLDHAPPNPNKTDADRMRDLGKEVTG